VTTPYVLQCWFFVECSPIQHAGGVHRFRFAFDEYGPRIEMTDSQGQTVPYQTFGLHPEDYFHVTLQELQALVQLFERSMWDLDPNAFFTYVPRASGMMGA
jgi:YD repeat-containing protein